MLILSSDVSYKRGVGNCETSSTYLHDLIVTLQCFLLSRFCSFLVVSLQIHGLGVSWFVAAGPHDVVGIQRKRVHPVTVTFQYANQQTL